MACLEVDLTDVQGQLNQTRRDIDGLDSFELAYKLQLEEVLQASAALSRQQGSNQDHETEVVMVEAGEELAEVRKLASLQESYLVDAAQGQVDLSLAQDLSKKDRREAALLQHDSLIARHLNGLSENEDSDACDDPIDVDGGAPADFSVRLCFAGSCQQHLGPAGCAAMLLSPAGDVLWQGKEHLGSSSLIQARYAALLAGLNKALELGFTSVQADGPSAVLAKVLGYEDVQQSSLMDLHARVTATIQKLHSFQQAPAGPMDNRVYDLARAAMHDQDSQRPAQGDHHKTPHAAASSSKQVQVPDVVILDSKEDDRVEQCKICLEEVPGSAIHVVGGCLHRFCKGCLGQHAITLIRAKTFPVRCPEAACSNQLASWECRVLLLSAPQELQQYLQMEAEAAIPEEARIYCPFPGCATLLLHEDAVAGEPSECPACHRALCAGCRSAWHQGLTCETSCGARPRTAPS